jgi:single-stranded DNA-binding protein
MSDFKKYDSDSNYIQHNARLTQDADVREFDGKKFVKLKFTDETRGQNKDGSDRYETMWVEAEVRDYDADKAALLKKGDVLTIEGKIAFRLWGEDRDKAAFDLKRAALHIPVSLFMQLQERGFAPGGKAAPKKGKAAPTKGKKKIVEIPEDDDE